MAFARRLIEASLKAQSFDGAPAPTLLSLPLHRLKRFRFLPVITAPLFFAEHGRVDGASRRLEGLPRRCAAMIRLPQCRDLSEMRLR
jgi:hypothetical protein